MDKRLHIVCFDVPYPVSHGGFYDLFYKIVALHQHGVQITLHCFAYGRAPQPVLAQYCKNVYYYKRENNLKSLSFYLPFIVASRKSKALQQNLACDNDPILLEGTHCTYLLYNNAFPQRQVFYRLHNIEHIYYRHLYQTEKAVLKKWYYWWESKLLLQYEKKAAPKAAVVFPVSQKDATQFKAYCPEANVQYLPVFLPASTIQNKKGSGDYCLYHGNLSVAENEQACIELIKRVFKHLSFTLIIAGRKPSRRLKQIAKQQSNVRLVANPTEAAMMALVQNAHVNLVVSMNATGIKLKLINALLYGRHCIANKAAIDGTELEACCTIANTPEQIKEAIATLMKEPFEDFHNAVRAQKLPTIFDNKANVQQLIKQLY